MDAFLLLHFSPLGGCKLQTGRQIGGGGALLVSVLQKRQIRFRPMNLFQCGMNLLLLFLDLQRKGGNLAAAIFPAGGCTDITGGLQCHAATLNSALPVASVGGKIDGALGQRRDPTQKVGHIGPGRRFGCRVQRNGSGGLWGVFQIQKMVGVFRQNHGSILFGGFRQHQRIQKAGFHQLGFQKCLLLR